jgi:hypothetical protein
VCGRLQYSKYAATESENMANSPKQAAMHHLSTSASVAGTLHLAAFASADSCEGFVISHETASLSLQVNQLHRVQQHHDATTQSLVCDDDGAC